VFKSDWKENIGTYSLNFKDMEFKWYAKIAFSFGYNPQKVEIYTQNNTLRIKSNYGESVLREYKAGLFFTNSNELLDFNNLIYRNIKIND
jgi:hypothetical protein